jgi:hypothetical protein
MYTALAILLGHNIFPHHHYDFEHSAIDHYHSDDHHHGDGNEDGENEQPDLELLFSTLQHGEYGITFLSSHNLGNTLSKRQFTFFAVLPDSYNFRRFPTFVRQNLLPYKVVYFNSQHYLPSGLRAPPAFIA